MASPMKTKLKHLQKTSEMISKPKQSRTSNSGLAVGVFRRAHGHFNSILWSRQGVASS